VKPVIEAAEVSIKDEIESVTKLAAVASNSPYYKYALSVSGRERQLIEADTTTCGLEIFRMLSSPSCSVDGLEGWALAARQQNLESFSRSKKSVRS
jgi:hypothetical protein